MSTPYDVFVSMNEGNIWIGTAKNLTEAIQLIGTDESNRGNSYLVFCQETRQKSYFKKENNSVVVAPSG